MFTLVVLAKIATVLLIVGAAVALVAWTVDGFLDHSLSAVIQGEPRINKIVADSFALGLGLVALAFLLWVPIAWHNLNANQGAIASIVLAVLASASAAASVLVFKGANT